MLLQIFNLSIKIKKKCVYSLIYCCTKCNITKSIQRAGQAEKTWEPSAKTLPFPTFWRNLEALRFEWRNLTSFSASLQERWNESNKYKISSCGNWTRNLSHLQSYTPAAGLNCYMLTKLSYIMYQATSKQKISQQIKPSNTGLPNWNELPSGNTRDLLLLDNTRISFFSIKSTFQTKYKHIIHIKNVK